jgi:protein SCO1
MQRRAIWAGVGTVAAVLLAAAIWMAAHQPALHGAVINAPSPAAEIHLHDYHGRDFTLTSMRGMVLVLYFGYTSCPDECPLTMAHLKLALDQAGADARDVRVVMITTDPTRDDGQALQEFLTKFSPDFIGLTGSEEELSKVWRDYGVVVEDGGEVHSYFIYVIDRSGKFRETFLPDTPASDIAADLKTLSREK